MKTHTIGFTPRSEIEASLPHKYHMEVNREDMLTILAALLEHSEGRDDVEDDDDIKESRENAHGLRGSILSTIGIEEV